MSLKASSEEFRIKLLSIVIPVYKKEKTIQKNILLIKDVCDKLPYEYEIICVIDGEVDKSRYMAKKIAHKFPNKVKVIGYLTNLGKGHAVRYGMARAKGDVIGFLDSGFDLNPSGIPILLEHMKWYNADIVIASKRHPASKVVYSWQRRIISWGFQMGVRTLFNLKIRDTQVGMKFFRREVLERVLPRVLVKQFAFDVEMLAVAHYLGYKKIYEGPAQVDLDFGGMSVVTSNFFKNAVSMAIDTLAIFYRLRILKYYDDKNKKNWITPDYLTLQEK